MRELEPLVERAEQLLRRAADLAEPGGAQRARCVAYAARRPVAAGRQRDGGDALGQERRLLVEAERKGEVEQLAESARPLCDVMSLLDNARRGRHQ